MGPPQRGLENMLIAPVKTDTPEGEKIIAGLLDRFQAADRSCQTAVEEILTAVKERGDEAVVDYGRAAPASAARPCQRCRPRTVAAMTSSLTEQRGEQQYWQHRRWSRSHRPALRRWPPAEATPGLATTSARCAATRGEWLRYGRACCSDGAGR